MSLEYSAAIQEIVQKLESRYPLPLLAPEREWDRELTHRLESASLDEIFDGQLVKDATLGKAVQSGLLLWNDALDVSHTISQSIENETGSYWHGIMHRREGDFSNSHYWFKKVGRHPVMSLIGGYDPHEFITAVETLHTDDPEGLIAMQRREWEALFSWCATNTRAEDE